VTVNLNEETRDSGNAPGQGALCHASGEATKSEAIGVGENEFVPWPVGVLA
jgi:altronate hydrolase